MSTPYRPKAFSYLRFSTPEQAMGDSLRRQMEAANDYAREQGLELVDKSYQDLGVSAYTSANAEMGMLAEFMEAVNKGVIPSGSWLLIESMDRLSRARPRRAVKLLESICESGITVVTLADRKVYNEETLDSDPMAFMWAYMVAMRAHEESEMKARRLRAAWSNKRAQARSRVLTSLAPGWLRVQNGRIEVIEERAVVVRTVFTMALKGMGQHRIAETLNCDGVRPFGRGKFWHKSYISKLLDNPAVIGTYIPHRIEHVSGKRTRTPLDPVEGYYPAILPLKVFDAVAATRTGSHAPRIRPHGLQNILASLALCPACGSTMTRVMKGSGNKSGVPRLVCTKAKIGAGCSYHSVRLPDVEVALTSNAERIAGSAPLSTSAVADMVNNASEVLDDLLEEARNLADALAHGYSPILRAKLDEQEELIEAQRTLVQSLLVQQKEGSPTLLQERVRTLSEALRAIPLIRLNANLALRSVLSGVVVDYRSGDLVLKWKHGGESQIEFTSRFEEQEG